MLLRSFAAFLALPVLVACEGSILPAAGTLGAPGDAPGGSSGSAPRVRWSCVTPEASAGPTPLRRLTRTQYQNAVKDVFGFTVNTEALSADERVGAFASNVATAIGELVVNQYRAAAELVAADVASRVNALLPCASDLTPQTEAACAQSFISSFGRKVYRRPLSAQELGSYGVVFTAGKAAGSFALGIRLVTEALLQSPHFLYFVEQSTGSASPDAPRTLTAYELATRLAFFLWNRPPDEALLDAAQRGELDAVEGLRARGAAMLDDDRAREMIAGFHLQWLGLDALPRLEKDAATFPGFDVALKAAMQRETETFVDHVVRRGDGKLATLLAAPFTFADGPLLRLYGLAQAPSTETARVELPERRGLLTQAAVLAVHAHARETSPVPRGVFLRRNVLCGVLGAPPPGVDATLPAVSPTASTREKFAAHESTPACAGCHKLIDPLGFAFETYDAIGAYRPTEHGQPIDTHGAIVGTAQSDGTFQSTLELVDRLAVSPDVRECVTQQWFRYALGRLETPADTCSLSAAHSAFGAADYNVRELMLALVSSDAFRLHREPQP